MNRLLTLFAQRVAVSIALLQYLKTSNSQLSRKNMDLTTPFRSEITLSLTFRALIRHMCDGRFHGKVKALVRRNERT